jgi:WD40 repeat protein
VMFMFCKVASGRLLRVWPAHYKAVSCLVFSEDDSLLISGADDGLVNVWPLLRSPHLAVELIFMFFSLKHLDLSENVNNIQKA